MSPAELMAKSRQALASAQFLLNAADPDGACNRAYYAMFDAARAALLVADTGVPAEVSRTHSGLISAFSLHLIKTGRLPVELGRSLNKVEDLRLIADYKGEPLELADAAWAVEQAGIFVEYIAQAFAI